MSMETSVRPSLPVRVMLKSILVIGYGFVLVPIASLVAFSFNSARFPSLPWQGFTLDWYATINDDPELMASLANSAKVAITVAVISTVLGSLAAYLTCRWEFKGKGAYLGFLMLPPAIPLLILALALLLYLNQLGLSGTLTAVTIGHVGLASAFVVGVVRLRLNELDRSLEEAAWNLGYGRWTTVRYVVLPQALPAIAASFFIAMAVSWDEFVIAWFVSGFDVTLPVKLFGVVNGYVSPTINAVGTIVFAITAFLVTLALLGVRIGSAANTRRSDAS